MPCASHATGLPRQGIDADIANYLVGAMDRATAERLRALGVAYFAMFDQAQHDTGLGEHDFGWGSGKFHKAGRQKLSLLQSLLGFGLDIVLCDTDMVWINDPTDYFNRFPAADILTSSDHMAPTIPVGDDGLELPSAMHSAMNIGAMLFRHSNATKVFVADWMAKLESDDKVWDQNAYNDLLRQGAVGEEAAGQHRLFAAHDGRLLVGVLPVAAFASGHTYHVQHLAPVRPRFRPLAALIFRQTSTVVCYKRGQPVCTARACRSWRSSRTSYIRRSSLAAPKVSGTGSARRCSGTTMRRITAARASCTRS